MEAQANLIGWIIGSMGRGDECVRYVSIYLSTVLSAINDTRKVSLLNDTNNAYKLTTAIPYLTYGNGGYSLQGLEIFVRRSSSFHGISVKI